MRGQFCQLRFIVGMIAEFGLILKRDNKPSQVMTGNADYVLIVGTKEVSKVTYTIGNSIDGLLALVISPGISLVSYQCVLECHDRKLLTLTAYLRGAPLSMLILGNFVKRGALFGINFLGKGQN